MKAWKFLIMLAGIAGLVGFFLPFARGADERTKMDQPISAYRLVRGIDVHELVADAERVGVSRVEAERAAKELDEGLSAARGFALLAYAPAALLALLGAIAVARGMLGRLGGVFALLLGGASAGIWALLAAASHEAHATTISLALGAHLLLVAGLGGLLGGLGALFAPDRG
jgi:hypothetical protein